MDITQKMRNVVRAIVGMPEDPGQPPQIDRLAWYRAQVSAAASDGSTCDVQCEDKRIGGANGVKVLVGIPGSVAVVSPGAVVMLGWEAGDPARPRCIPVWEQGATVNKLTFSATEIDLGGNSHPLPLFDTFENGLTTWVAAMKTMINALVTPTAISVAAQTAAATACDTLTAAIAAKSYESTKVKNV